MSTRKSNTVHLKSQLKPQLTDREVRRIAERLASSLEHDSEDIALLTLLFDHMEQTHDAHGNIFDVIYTVKTYLFIGTNESANARDRFQQEAYAKRGKLLKWPNERKEFV